MLNNKKLLRSLVVFIAAAVLFYIGAIFWFDWKAVLVVLKALGAQTLLIGAILASTSYVLRFYRWEHSLSCQGHKLPRFRHLGIYLSGLALTATPGKSGEMFRSALLLQEGVPVSRSLAAFIVDRASDVLGVCLLGGLTAWIVGAPFAWVWGGAFFSMLLGSFGVVYFQRHPLELSNVRVEWLQRLLQSSPMKIGKSTLENWASVWELSRILIFSSIAMLAYGIQAIVFAWFCSVANTGLSAANCVLIFVQASLFGAASMLPAGLGAMEAALVLQMTERGVDDGVAVSLAIAIRLVTLWLGMLIGAISLFCSSRTR